MGAEGKSGFRKYRELTYGTLPPARALLAECVTFCFGSMPGGLGLWVRSKLYRCLFGSIGRKVFFGRNVTLRHAHKIRLGDGVIVDDGAVLDAKGETNAGIAIGDNVYIGRNTIVYCKNGDIRIGRNVNISANCQVYSSNALTLGPDTVIGAFTYLLSGGAYDYRDTTRTFAEQSGMETKGPLTIGANCWIGAHVSVLDAACVGDHCVLGAGAVVTRPIPANSIAVGVPARVVKTL
jgi:acetyltransferase-like isoleucine patch superfamily enzyme